MGILGFISEKEHLERTAGLHKALRTERSERKKWERLYKSVSSRIDDLEKTFEAIKSRSSERD